MGKKILLADDSITIQKVIELTFSDEDFEVVTVGNGRAAIEKVQDVRPDLVLCDIIMPEKDGYEVCDFIKKTPGLSHIPVLLLTGAFEPFDQDRANRVGCDGFLAKPFEPQTLIAKVKDLLNQTATRTIAGGPRAVAAPAPAPSPAPSAPEPPMAPPYAAPSASSHAPPSAPALHHEADSEPAFISDEPLEETPTMISPTYEEGGRHVYDEPPVPPPGAETPPAEELSYVEELSDAEGELMDVSPEESATLQGEPEAEAEAEPEAEEEPASSAWAQPTVEVPLETRAQASVEARTSEPGFDQVFEEEKPAAAAPAAPAAKPAAAPTTAQTEDFGFVRTQDVSGSPATPSLPSAAAPETVREGFGWVRQADLPGTPPAPPTTHGFASAPEPEKRAPEPFEEEPPAAESSFGTVAASASEPSAPPSGAAEVGVPMDMVEKIAQRVVAQISEKVIREIAWEVIPDLAENLLKKEIDRLKAELQRT
jgi:CheY-like chemotaxis protein